ncbi:Uncharacterised protein [Collinsella sp. AK_207A]|nr:Uncharacterised protein [Collinsella sp. AK_207A]
MDAKGRRRCKTIAFRMSPAEADQLDLRVALSGLSKQDFIARSLLEGTFTVVATTRMRKAVKERVGPVVAELRRIRRAGDMDDELVESLETLSAFAGSFVPERSPVELEDALIANLGMDDGLPYQSSTVAQKHEPNVRRTLSMNLSMMNSARRRAVLRDYGLDHPLSEEELVERLVDVELRLSRLEALVSGKNYPVNGPRRPQSRGVA